jgi:hypothetical protein
VILQDSQIWFVHFGFEPPLPLKIERTNDLGAKVIGGRTGSHRTGHGENYWDKVVEVIRLGYVPVDVAKDIKRLDLNWTPPDEATLDQRIGAGFHRKKL